MPSFLLEASPNHRHQCVALSIIIRNRSRTAPQHGATYRNATQRPATPQDSKELLRIWQLVHITIVYVAMSCMCCLVENDGTDKTILLLTVTTYYVGFVDAVNENIDCGFEIYFEIYWIWIGLSSNNSLATT